MKWKAKQNLPTHKEVREVKKFAWLPSQIDTYMVWLSFYGVTEQFLQPNPNTPGIWVAQSKTLLS